MFTSGLLADSLFILIPLGLSLKVEDLKKEFHTLVSKTYIMEGHGALFSKTKNWLLVI